MLDSLFGFFLTGQLADGFPVFQGGSLLGEAGSFVLVAAFESVRSYSLALGIGGVAGGILLFVNHKKRLDSALASGVEQRIKDYESRKYRRRATVSAMIASVGCMLAALNWVSDARVFSVFILMILSLLMGILGVALFDLFSVGLQQIATPDEKSRKAMIEEFLRQREKQAAAERHEDE